MVIIGAPDLTERQREILALRVGGHGRRQIADQLGITVKTVRDHIDAARDRLDAPDEVGALIAFDRLRRRSLGG